MVKIIVSHCHLMVDLVKKELSSIIILILKTMKIIVLEKSFGRK